MCQSSRLFSYVLVTKTKHIYFQVSQQLGSVYTALDQFLKRQNFARIRLSFTREPRNRESFWRAKCASFWPDQKKVKTNDRTVPFLRGLLLALQVFAQFAR